ncbi:amino acid adenylation domain-containing protein/non-ribosomal peptide synthase protein (TIGR01720 family) [Paenibacillus jamilae]|nr:non-ribosomal peptide synthetase [Paenibacillus polymyxa]MDP9678220.1 amino acid adenylation domain-containing protein/non-ribosomal peptide synthase protein (TIGR01720 family) [Paenibacillus jamilae]MBY0025386.1 non-ribosomal peptide synthetase [Paenibacillus polymyxa]MBY0059952.1 non-ribosomal peptide synthetase [Paenibacillus polymyxa]MBY0073243.1 non-ribosomal peptide synthetase [Paenibacillus polymyxa]MBY0081141.1 non-ribosomal peptide synthetase [Paenibacillus polymyxa]
MSSVNLDHLYPLTHAQKRIWYIEKIYQGTAVHNIGGTVRIKGKIDPGILEKAIHCFVQGHEGLRMQVTESDGEVYQRLNGYAGTKIDFFDFSSLDNACDEYDRWLRNKVSQPFVLTNTPLYYFAMLKFSDNEYGYFIMAHHIVSDGWSMGILIEQISDNYAKLSNNESIAINPDFSYLDYIGWEKDYLASKRMEKDKGYWKSKFASLPDHLAAASDDLAGARKSFKLSEELTFAVNRFCAENQVSLNSFFSGAYALYMYKLNNQQDIIIGNPVSNRVHRKYKTTFGMFTSTMPLRIGIEENTTCRAFIQNVHKELFHCFQHQKYPFNQLVKDLELSKRGYSDLFNICVNFYNTKPNRNIAGCSVELEEFHNGEQIYSLQFIIKEWSGSEQIEFHIDYKSKEYQEREIDKLYGRMLLMIEQIVERPSEYLSKLSIMTRVEQQLIQQVNERVAQYTIKDTIIGLFEQQVNQTPDHIALSFENENVSYNVLNEKANQIANLLVSKGAKPNSIIGVMCYHSVEVVAAILGILKIGAAYLPLNEDYPIERMNYIFEDSQTSFILTNVTPQEHIKFKGTYIRLLQNDEIARSSTVFQSVQSSLEDLVYVIYTSGSTGNPKGVQIENKGLVNYISWASEQYISSSDETFALYSSLGFDLTVTSIFTPLITGNSIIIYKDDGDEFVLYKVMRENRANIVKLTPAHLRLLKDTGIKNTSIKKLIVGGEDLKAELARDITELFNNKVDIFNEYGPTEATVGCMIYKFDKLNDTVGSVPIGVPIDNSQLYILDANLNPVPVGTEGELFIAGEGLARGYLNRPDTTSRSFLDNPFSKGTRLYRSGDAARLNESGIMEYLGRIDQQVKIKGFRIELGDIESNIRSHSSVNDAVVIDWEDSIGSKALYAFIVPDSNFSERRLREELARLLPAYMIPSYYYAVDQIPLSINGKVDKKALIEYMSLSNRMESQYEEDLSFTETEHKILHIYRDILGRPNLELDDDFLVFGGDSIKAIQIANRLEQIGLKIKVKDILNVPVIRNQIDRMDDAAEGAIIQQTSHHGVIKPTPIYQWFFNKQLTNREHWNQSVLLTLNVDLSNEQWNKLLFTLIVHHDTLRINLNDEGSMIYNDAYLEDRAFAISSFDLTELSMEEQQNSIATIGNKLKSSFNLQSGLLFKAGIIQMGGKQKDVLLLTAHHLLVDGISWRIILEDIHTLIGQTIAQEQLKLPSKTSSMQNWSEKLYEYGMTSFKEMKYWDKIENSSFEFQVDHNGGVNTYGNLAKHIIKLDEAETEFLLGKANQIYGTDPGDLLIIALAFALQQHTNQNEILLEAESHGREHIDEAVNVSRTVGWFTSLYPIRLVMEQKNLSDQIKSLKQQLHEVPHKGIGYGINKYILRKLPIAEKKRIRFNYLGELDNIQSHHYFLLSDEPSGDEISRNNDVDFLIDIIAFVKNKEASIIVQYSTDWLKESTVTQLMDGYMSHIRSLLDHCLNKEDREFTPSDFDLVDVSLMELDQLFK